MFGIRRSTTTTSKSAVSIKQSRPRPTRVPASSLSSANPHHATQAERLRVAPLFRALPLFDRTAGSSPSRPRIAAAARAHAVKAGRHATHPLARWPEAFTAASTAAYLIRSGELTAPIGSMSKFKPLAFDHSSTLITPIRASHWRVTELLSNHVSKRPSRQY